MNDNFDAILEKVYATASAAGEFASKAVDSAGKKAGGVYSASKIKLKIFNIKTDIDILYKEVGKLVYAEHNDEEVQRERLSALLEAIDDKKKELEALNKALAEVKGIRRCPSCGEENSQAGAFCSSCGAEL